MKKLEVIIDKSYFNKLVEKLETVGIVGYSAMDVIKGRGEKHDISSDGAIMANNLYVISMIDPSVVEKVKSELTPLITETGGIFIISSVEYSFVK